jgi:hypothetical protein
MVQAIDVFRTFHLSVYRYMVVVTAGRNVWQLLELLQAVKWYSDLLMFTLPERLTTGPEC